MSRASRLPVVETAFELAANASIKHVTLRLPPVPTQGGVRKRQHCLPKLMTPDTLIFIRGKTSPSPGELFA
eukprot:1182954-Prorocentrum_minimum.AAC.1